MKTNQTRTDDYPTRRAHLTSLSDTALKNRFWELANQAVLPMIDFAKTHTSPSIERSVLLRMGFSSLEAKALVDKVILHQLIGKGAGHVVYRFSLLQNCSVRAAGLALLHDQGWDEIKAYWGRKS